jgi:cell division septal protein FtsQ
MQRRRNAVRARHVRQTPLIYGNLQKPKRDYSSFFRFIKLTAWFGSLAAIVWVLFWSPVFKVTQVEVEGSLLSNATAISESVPRGGSIWFFSESTVRAQILASQPVIDVKVYRGIPHSVKVVVEERKPVILWQSGEGVSLIDAGGEVLFTYKLADFPTSEVEPGTTLNQLSRVIDSQSIGVVTGTNIAAPQFVEFVANLQREMATYLPELKVVRLEVQQTTYDLLVVAESGLRVQMNTLGEAAPQVRNLARLITQENIASNAQVDLRIDRWAYVTP